MQNKRVFRLLLVIIAITGYLFTVARTVSLWDCGEFIATIHTQGIAHPPGTPFYMLIGRAWEILLFFLTHSAFRINLLSVFCSVTACLLLFEITVDISNKIQLPSRSQLSCGLLSGSTLAFTDTFWFNGVEAEVYAFSIMEMLLGFWVLIKWYNHGHQPYSRWILLLIYISFLGIGVHMYSMLLVPFLFFFIGLKTNRVLPGKFFSLLGGIIVTGFILCFINPGFIENTWFLFIILGLCLVFLVKAISAGEIKDISYWTFCLLLCTVIVLTKPFLTAMILLFACLCLALIVFDYRAPASWIVCVVGILITTGLFYLVPLKGEFAFSLQKTDMWTALILGIITLMYTVFALWKQQPQSAERLHFYLFAILLALTGYSTFLYIPIRSHQNPVIDENDPETWERLQAFIERKQYGNESMLVRMFHRRGLWSSQFGYGLNMGYWRYHSSQLVPMPNTEKKGSQLALNIHVIFSFGLLLLVIGVWLEHYKRNPAWMGFILFLFIVCSVGLVLYMNFADGKRIEVNQLKHWKKSVESVREKLSSTGIDVPAIPDPNAVNDFKSGRLDDKTINPFLNYLANRQKTQHDNWVNLNKIAQDKGHRLPEIPAPVHREVRVRDYFFTPAFVFYVLMLSITLFLLLEALSRKHPRLEKLAVPAGLCLALSFWLLPFLTHFKSHNRAYDFIAADFAWNLLQSCPQNSILFTNGDNDTFPLWYLQQVESVRQDVTVINFSLANTDWYARQFTYQQPSVRFPSLANGGTFPQPQYIRFSKTQRIPLPGDTSIAFSLGGPGTPMFIRTQDRVLIEAAMYNFPMRPLCFTLSTPRRASLGLEQYFQTVGLVNVLAAQPGTNLAAMDRNILNSFRYRYIDSEYSGASAAAKRIIGSYRRIIRIAQKAHVQRIQHLQQQQKDEPDNSQILKFIQEENILLQKYRELEIKLSKNKD
ncbi:MAG: DUF2723 domain-containing protein [Fibrobacteria bacterium]|nr:DUF2723 domain-containing protein [Fibrobacteria bacterium]